jgi:hypothetical protein
MNWYAIFWASRQGAIRAQKREAFTKLLNFPNFQIGKQDEIQVSQILLIPPLSFSEFSNLENLVIW